MANNKAFIRYANNKAVPGSLIVRKKAPSVGVWKEVNYDLCCDGGNTETCCSGEVVTLSFTPPVTTFNGLRLQFYCNGDLISYGLCSVEPITNLLNAVSQLNITYGVDPDSPGLSPIIGNFSLDGDTILLTMTDCKKQTYCPVGSELTFDIISALPD